MTDQKALDQSLLTLSAVQQFECGRNPWELEVAEWIRAPEGKRRDSAIWCAEKGNTSVWLHLLPGTEQVVGFSSLGATNWGLFGGEKVPVQIIPNFGVASEFQSKPDATDGGPSYASFIFQLLIHEACRKWRMKGEPQVLALYVHPNNAKAIGFYKRRKFHLLPDPAENGYNQMIRVMGKKDDSEAPIGRDRVEPKPDR